MNRSQFSQFQKKGGEEELMKKMRQVQRKRDLLIYEYRKRCQAVEKLETEVKQL